MKLIPFLDDLALKYERVGNHRAATNPDDFNIRKTEMGYSFYAVSVDDLVADNGVEISKTGTVFFKVYDEGTGAERVVLEEKPAPDFQRRPDDTAFKDAVITWYGANKPASIVKFEVLELNKDLQFATLRVFDVVADIATEKKIFIYKEGTTIKAVTLV